MSKKWQIGILLGIGLLTRFLFFGHPDQTVFDEVHFGKFVSAYYTGEFYFDIHPALGKQMIAGFAKLAGFKPEFEFAEIGDAFPSEEYVTLRFLPSLAGALLPVIIFLILLEMRVPAFAAFTGGLLIALENALLTQSHYILMDAFMLLFGFSSLLFYLKYRNSSPGRAKYLFLAGLFAGLSMSIKWIAVSFLGLILLFEAVPYVYRLIQSNWIKLDLKELGIKTAALAVLPFMVYYSVFMIEFALLDKAGSGDAFMSPQFQKNLKGNIYENDATIKASGSVSRFLEMNKAMFQANQRLSTATHPYSSKWYTWPFMSRPIYYWVNGDARIYLIGNPVIWWMSAAAVIWVILSFATRPLRYLKDPVLPMLFAGYVFNMLPYMQVSRVMFIYHYFIAYIFAILMLVYALAEINKNKIIFAILITASVISFIFFAPLSYGLDLTPSAYEMRVWFGNWK